jgi:hypothetical protein
MGANGMSERPAVLNRRMSYGATQAEAGPSGSGAAVSFLKGVKESLVFFNSKVSHSHTRTQK